MRKLCFIGIFLLVVGCATVHAPRFKEGCNSDTAYKKGLQLSKSENAELVFHTFCGSNTRKEVKEAFQRGVEEKNVREKANSLEQVASSLPKATWLCEVEGQRKIFTGIADSVAEASALARQNCARHFQAKSCVDAGCQSNF